MTVRFHSFVFNIFSFTFLFIAGSSYANAENDLNVLIIGSEKGSMGLSFSPSQIKLHLEKILKGTEQGKVNVNLEDRSSIVKNSKFGPFDLASWFHFPYPENVETESRWPNLRGEKGTKWDYVILIGDPSVIETMPGLYAHGVAKVAEEAAKGSAETVLLMPWPAKASTSTVAHYKEVIYRTGRSGGFKVAPAGLAWEAAGKPSGETHPSNDGAYIAAATLYSRIWNKNASESSYKYNEKLADTAHKTVLKNTGIKQYEGSFKFENAFSGYDIKTRSAAPRKAPGGRSTEEGLVHSFIRAMNSANVSVGGSAVYMGRSPRYTFVKSEVPVFGFVYQTHKGTTDQHIAEIFPRDILLAAKMHSDKKNHRIMPRRLIWAGLYQDNPELRPLGSHGHLSGDANISSGTYMYTIYSGRCPVDPKPQPVTDLWRAQMEGYEIAWRLSRCQTRAPGFKVTPSSMTQTSIDITSPEIMTVQFLLKPRENVTVNVSCSNGAAASPSSLTFTSENYHIPQHVTVKPAAGTETGKEIKVEYRTVSGDEVYNGLFDSWDYSYTPVFSVTYEAARGGTVQGLVNQKVAEGKSTQPVRAIAEQGYIFKGWSQKAIVNLSRAEGVIASQSSTRKDNLAARALDGNRNTVESNKSLAQTNGEENAWWQVQFPEASEISEIAVFRPGGKGMLQKFQVSIFSGSKEVFTKVIENENTGSLRLAVPGSISGDRVRISCVGDQKASITLAEVEVFGSKNEALRTDSKINADITFKALFEKSDNTAPVAYPSSLTLETDSKIPLILKASDFDKDKLTYSIVRPPQHGTLSGSAPNLIYTAKNGFSGHDSFTFKVNDGSLDSQSAKVTIGVGNLPPVIAVDSPKTRATALPFNVGLLLETSVTDDAKSSPLKLSWTQVSGPSRVKFLSPNEADTAVSFPNIKGVYVFKITAEDGVHSSSELITVEFGFYNPKKNLAPHADPGTAYSGTVNKDIPIDKALISDDGLPLEPGKMSIEWRQVSGPGKAEIAKPAESITSVRCSKPGKYILRLSVSDGEVKSYHDVTVDVK